MQHWTNIFRIPSSFWLIRNIHQILLLVGGKVFSFSKCSRSDLTCLDVIVDFSEIYAKCRLDVWGAYSFGSEIIHGILQAFLFWLQIHDLRFHIPHLFHVHFIGYLCRSLLSYSRSNKNNYLESKMGLNNLIILKMEIRLH